MFAHLDHIPQSKDNTENHIGKESTISMPSQVLVRAQLEMTSHGDPDELEADQMAEVVVSNGKLARAVYGGHSNCGIALPSRFSSQLSSMQGHGSQLYGDLKTRMESSFGMDFSNVRIHTDGAAAAMSDSISAKAFTYGSDIYFNQGQFNPSTTDGQRLIAHELTHVVQGNGRINRQEEQNSSMAVCFEPQTVKEKRDYIRSFSTSSSLVLKQTDLPEKARRLYSTYQTMARRFISQSEHTISRAEGGQRNPVNVVIYMSIRADYNGALCQEFSSNRKFENVSNLIVLQEVDSIRTCTKLLQLINEVIGPIQNLIISGHGSYDSIRLNPSHSFQIGTDELTDRALKGFSSAKKELADVKDTEDFFKVVGTLMSGDVHTKKKIVLDACLAASRAFPNNSNQPNFASRLSQNLNIEEYDSSFFDFDWLPWKDKQKNIEVIGSQASLRGGSIVYNYDEKNKELKTKFYFDLIERDPLTSSQRGYVGPAAVDISSNLLGIATVFEANRDFAELKKNWDEFFKHLHWLNANELRQRNVLNFNSALQNQNNLRQRVEDSNRIITRYANDKRGQDINRVCEVISLLYELQSSDFENLAEFRTESHWWGGIRID